MRWPREIPELRPGRVHEVAGPAARAFAAVQAAQEIARLGAARPAAPVLWILPPRPKARLDPYGLARFFAPERLILIEAATPADVFWAFEECLRAGAAAIAVAETERPADLTQSRRLQLAAEDGVKGVLLIPQQALTRSNAAESRWRADPAPAWATGAGAPAWLWSCVKNKRGAPGRWLIRWGAASTERALAAASA